MRLLRVALALGALSGVGVAGGAVFHEELGEWFRPGVSQAQTPPTRHQRRQDGEVPVGKAGKGKTKVGQGPPGEGEAARVNALTLSFNNASSALRTQDGALHSVVQDKGALLYTREDRSGGVLKVTLVAADAQLPAIASDGQDLVVAWSQGKPSKIYASISKDGGKSWSKAAQVSSGTGSTPSLRAWRTRAGMQIAAAWHTPFFERAPQPMPVTVWASSWSEGAWSQPTQLSAEGERAAFVALAGGEDGLYATWRQERADSTWGIELAQQRRGRWQASEALDFAGYDPGLCVDPKGTLHLGYHNQRSAYVSRSTDGGETWSQPQLLGSGFFVHAQCADSGAVAMSFEMLENGGSMFDASNKTFGLFVSQDGGATWARQQVAGGATGMTRSSTCFNPDGSLELFWVQDDGSTLELKRGQLTP